MRNSAQTPEIQEEDSQAEYSSRQNNSAVVQNNQDAPDSNRRVKNGQVKTVKNTLLTLAKEEAPAS